MPEDKNDGMDEIILDNGDGGEGEDGTDGATGDGKTPETTPKPEAPDWESDENPYKVRHAASSKEVQENLLPKIQANEARIAELQKQHDEALAKLKEEKPEAYDNLALQRSVEQSNRQLAELKEKVEIDSFIAANPLAAGFRDALRQHARANPSASLDDLWKSTGLKDVAETRAKEADAKKKTQTNTQPDRGSTTGEPGKTLIAGKYTEAEFNKLSVSERRKILAQMEGSTIL